MGLFTKLIDKLTGRAALKRRGLLPFFDGTRQRWGDPFLLWRKIFTHPLIDLNRHGAAADVGREPETSEYVQALTEIFGVARWDDRCKKGLTDWEVLDLVRKLSTHLMALKKNISPGPTSSPSSASAASSGREPQKPATSEPSASGSIPAESTSAAV